MGEAFRRLVELHPRYVLGTVIHELHGHREYRPAGPPELSLEDPGDTGWELYQFVRPASDADTREDIIQAAHEYMYPQEELYALLRGLPYEVDASEHHDEIAAIGLASIDFSVSFAIGRWIKPVWEPRVAKALMRGLYQRFRLDPRLTPEALGLFRRAVRANFTAAEATDILADRTSATPTTTPADPDTARAADVRAGIGGFRALATSDEVEGSAHGFARQFTTQLTGQASRDGQPEALAEICWSAASGWMRSIGRGVPGDDLTDRSARARRDDSWHTLRDWRALVEGKDALKPGQSALLTAPDPVPDQPGHAFALLNVTHDNGSDGVVLVDFTAVTDSDGNPVAVKAAVHDPAAVAANRDLGPGIHASQPFATLTSARAQRWDGARFQAPVPDLTTPRDTTNPLLDPTSNTALHGRPGRPGLWRVNPDRLGRRPWPGWAPGRRLAPLGSGGRGAVVAPGIERGAGSADTRTGGHVRRDVLRRRVPLTVEPLAGTGATDVVIGPVRFGDYYGRDRQPWDEVEPG